MLFNFQNDGLHIFVSGKYNPHNQARNHDYGKEEAKVHCEASVYAKGGEAKVQFQSKNHLNQNRLKPTKSKLRLINKKYSSTCI